MFSAVTENKIKITATFHRFISSTEMFPVEYNKGTKHWCFLFNFQSSHIFYFYRDTLYYCYLINVLCRNFSKIYTFVFKIMTDAKAPLHLGGSMLN